METAGGCGYGRAMRPHVALIGCGGISRLHLTALEQARATVRWTCDLVPELAKAAAARCGAQAGGDWRPAIADPAVGLVIVGTCSNAHRDVCLAAIAAGKAVLSEKTLANDAATSWEITSAAQAAGVRLRTNYMKRYLPAVAKARELLPELGELISTHARTWQPWGDLWLRHPAEGSQHTPPGGVSGQTQRYGGAALPCAGSHILDLVHHLVGRPSRVFADENVPAGRDYDMRTSALMRVPGRGSVLFEACAHPLNHIGFNRDGWDEVVEISGVHGRLTIHTPMWDQGDRIGSLLIHEDARTRAATEHRFAPVSPFNAAVAAALDGAPDHELDAGYAVDELIAALQRSARSGNAVDVPWRN